MNNASLASERLQRTLRVLQEHKGPISTRGLMRKANICAVSSVIAELRENGADIVCQAEMTRGKRVYYYTLIKSPEAA